MAYRLAFDDDAGVALRRAGAEQLEDAVTQLREGDDPARAVHEARKDLKKARAVLRLSRSSLPRKARGRAQDALREAGRALSAARDADVLIETVEALQDRYAGQVPGFTFERVVAALRDDAAAGATPDRAEVAARIDAVRQAWPAGDASWGAVRADATRAYARGLEAMERARKRPGDERLHDWRKRAKDLWYHERLLRDLWPEVMKTQAAETKRLTQALGDDHDLAVLDAALGRLAPDLRGVDVDGVRGLLGRRRAELQAEAFARGARIYAEPPKAFEARLRGRLRAARAAAADPSGERPAGAAPGGR
jgi:CHAD domain-containing protein